MLKDWLKLRYLKSVLPAQKRALVKAYGSPGKIFEADRISLHQTRILDEAGINAILKSNDGLLQSDLELLESIGCQFIGFNDPVFSNLLNEIPAPPLGLFALGSCALLQKPQIAIVGSRHASPSGKKTTESFAAELTSMGFTVTSGMAEGVDSHAHRGSLSAGNATIAVLGTGIDKIYPRSNRKLYHEISARGLVVTEFAPGTPPQRWHFPQRNRIISGLSLGTLVVEAGIHSGSLITARLAAEQGREVFAIPGSIHMPTSRGCHHLIRQGAKLVESVQDITDEIGHYFVHSSPPSHIHSRSSRGESSQQKSSSSEYDHPVYNLIDYAPISMDQLIELSGLTAEQVSSILIDLELRGLIADLNGRYQRLP